MSLLECVPNLAEGRRSAVVDRLAEVVRKEPGVALLDRSSDPDHDRTVLTLAGEPAPLHRALLALYEAAIEAIDLAAPAAHPSGEAAGAGVHPRVGAVDVVPFVPLDRTPMEVAVEAARRLGEAVAERFSLPVFLYERAARAPERAGLAAIRRGGGRGLARRMAEEPAWSPDFGPTTLHPTAGATAIGARDFLIAFNVLLDTDDVDAARAVARAVRESSGGLPGVKALGLRLASRRRVQVSMNLVDWQKTSPFAAYRAVRREAAARGIEVVESELVGLMPEEAAAAALADALRLPGLDASRFVGVRRRHGAGQDEPAG